MVMWPFFPLTHDSMVIFSSVELSELWGRSQSWTPLRGQRQGRWGGVGSGVPECGAVTVGYPLIKPFQKTMERSTMLLMGKSTISIGPFSIAMLIYQRVVASGNHGGYGGFWTKKRWENPWKIEIGYRWSWRFQEWNPRRSRKSWGIS